MDKIISIDLKAGCGLEDIAPKEDVLEELYAPIKIPDREYLDATYKVPPMVIKEFGIEKAVDIALTNLFQDLKWRMMSSLLKQYKRAEWKETLSKNSCTKKLSKEEK